MRRWLVLGGGGMLGTDLVSVLRSAGESVTAPTHAELDLRDAAAAVPGHDIVVNAAAWTDVDGAETQPDAALAVNGEAVFGLARAVFASGGRLIQISTDYVFAGDAASPYPEDAPTAPVNAYGRSKLAGELAVTRTLPDHGYVVRSAWLYGEHGRNFVATILRLAAGRSTLSIVDDQRGQPTWSYALASQVAALGLAAVAGRAPAGVYHGTASGETTWYGLAREVLRLAGLDPARVQPTTSAAFPRPAARPAYSVLGHDRWTAAGLDPLPDWAELLAAALPKIAAALPKITI